MQIELVVTCTDRKKAPVPADLQLRQLTRVEPRDRVAQWTGRLDSHPTQEHPAVDLYSGDHWAVARDIGRSYGGDGPVRLWVCSAGYGLVPWSARLKPYAATFAPSHPDSVQTLGIQPADWWAALATWRPRSVSGPRRLSDLAATHPRSFLLICLSEPYLRALSADLSVLAQSRPLATCAIICSGVRRHPELGHLLLPATARWKLELGGAMQSLNIRLARLALRHIPHWRGDGVALCAWLEAKAARLPSLQIPSRTRLSDETVKAWIRQELWNTPDASTSNLLRRLRGTGQACEQGRFRALYLQVAAPGQAR